MALDFKEIRKVVIDTVKLAIGDLLTQTTNPQTQETYGIVFNARPNPELPVPDYPYAVLDILTSNDTDWYLTALTYDDGDDEFAYNTHKTLEVQVSIYGSNTTLGLRAIDIAENLKTAYRRDDMIALLRAGGIGLGDVETVQILPELLQTDFLEAAFVQMSLRVNDMFVDPNLESIENVIIDGELTGSLNSDPILIDIDTTS